MTAPTELLDILTSLTAVMGEETDKLTAVGRFAEHGVMAQAKARLTGMLDAELARLGRADPAWLDALDADERATLLAAFAALKEAGDANAAIVERQLDLSRDLIAAVTREAKRVTGRRGVAYHPGGTLRETAYSAPISVNTAL